MVIDVGHGAGGFSFRAAEKALSEGVLPGTISSDLHIDNIEGPVYDLVTTMSKFMHLGMSLDDVISRCTEATARTIGKDGKLGTLRPGAHGDVTHSAAGGGALHTPGPPVHSHVSGRHPVGGSPSSVEASEAPDSCPYDQGREGIPALARHYAGSARAIQPAMDFEVAIRGGLVFDGTGTEPAETDVGIVGDAIAAVGDLS